MPMTEEESRKSVAISGRYMSPRQAHAFASDMWHEVGEASDNPSVRDTLKSFFDLTSGDELPPIPTGIYLAWIGLFAAHWVVAVCNVAAAVVLIFCSVAGDRTPGWAIAFPAVTFVVWSSLSRNYDCPLTRAEDSLRSKHGLPPVNAFLKHYLVDPLRRAWRLP